MIRPKSMWRASILARPLMYVSQATPVAKFGALCTAVLYGAVQDTTLYCTMHYSSDLWHCFSSLSALSVRFRLCSSKAFLYSTTQCL